MKSTNDIKTVIGLFRVSTEEQELEGNSLDAQERLYKRDCENEGWASLRTFRGQETGRALESRIIIHDVMSAIHELAPDALWLREQSRLTRGDQLDVAILLRELRESRTKVVTEGGHILDLTDIEGEFVFGLKALIDRREYQVIRRRIMLGKDEKARRGLLSNGRTPYGYRVAGEGRDRGKRVIHSDEAMIVKLIFESKAAGRSLRQISKELFERGVDPPSVARRIAPSINRRTREGRAIWSIRTLSQMLHNPTYLGVSFHHCWATQGDRRAFDPTNDQAIWIEDAHEAIVSRTLWQAAHHMLNQHRSSHSSAKQMLTGILCCPKCGASCGADGKTHGKRSYRYYICGKKRRYDSEKGGRRRDAKACSCKYFKIESTDVLMWQGLMRLITTPELLQEDLHMSHFEQQLAGLRRKAKQLKRQIDSSEHKLSIAREKLLSEVFTDDEYLKEKHRLEKSTKVLGKEYEEIQGDIASMSPQSIKSIIKRLAVLKVGSAKMTKEQRVCFFRSLVVKITPNDETLRVCKFELALDIPAKWIENPIKRRHACTSFH